MSHSFEVKTWFFFKSNQKNDLNSVCITKNFELCVSVLTWQLKLQFWFTIRNALLIGNIKIRKISFDKNHDHAHWSRFSITNISSHWKTSYFYFSRLGKSCPEMSLIMRTRLVKGDSLVLYLTVHWNHLVLCSPIPSHDSIFLCV